MNPEIVLETSQLVAGYEPGLPIVRGTSIVVHREEIVIILGPNGAGKSTLLKAIAGLVPVQSGTVHLAGRDITGIATHRLLAERVAIVPQTDNVFTTMTVEENLMLVSVVLPKRHRRSRIEAMYELFPDLARFRHTRTGRLSGGQRQMVAMARGLMVEPIILLLDEPSAGLSPLLVKTVFEKLQEIRRQGVTIVMVEQNAYAALAIGDRAYVLVEGIERHEGVAAAMLNDPNVAKLYLDPRRATT
jgi:branched-chain amino acid transport system ATP-binding protein